MFQLTAARRRLVNHFGCKLYVHFVSTHSRPKAAGTGSCYVIKNGEFQLTAARRRLDIVIKGNQQMKVFQLTAARRRLETLEIRHAV